MNFKITVAEDNKIGLLGIPPIKSNEALLMIFPYADFWPVHTMGMTYSIDVLWLDRDNMIVDMTTLIPETPGVISDLPAYKVLELRAGMAKIVGFRPGDHLILSSNK